MAQLPSLSDSHFTHCWTNTLELLYDLSNEIGETVDRFPEGYKTAIRLVESLEPIADRDFRDEERVCRSVGVPTSSSLERENREAVGGRVVRPMRGSDARQSGILDSKLLAKHCDLMRETVGIDRIVVASLVLNKCRACFNERGSGYGDGTDQG